MPKDYHHLSYDLRCQIYALFNRGLSQNQISKDLEVSQSTISRELSRNSGKRGYRYNQAHNKAMSRKIGKANARKMNTELFLFVESLLLNFQWSPEQISDYLQKSDISISHETIYKHIWNDKRNGGSLFKQLRNRGKKYSKRKGKTSGRGVIPNRVGIEHRPKIVDEKTRVGDFELDTIVGKNHKGAILSIVDRKTKLTRLALLQRSTADKTANAIVQLLDPIKSYTHTLTADNGKEFANHEKVTLRLEASFYFANPYHAWERGLNENTNRLVRQYFPKGTDFTTITHEQVKNVECLLNYRPRKTLNFQSPIKAFYQATNFNLGYALGY
jgi:IS30 family transposase